MFPRPYRRAAEPRLASRRKRNPAVESLEGRQLMSLGAEFQVSVPTPTSQIQSANASSSNGSSVVVWTQFSQGQAEIMAQRLNAQGGKVGSPFVAASGSGLFDEQPSVAMDGRGDFVVSWTQFRPTGNSFVLAQKFNSAGQTVGGVVPVGVGTFQQTNSSVAMDAKGDFVVSYTRNTNNNNPDVFAKLYNSNEQLLNVVTVAGTAQREDLSSVAMTPDGRFDVAYQVQLGTSNFAVMADRYTASGGLLEQAVIANNGSLNESPKVAMDNHGNAVIAYQAWNGKNWDVKARRLAGNGALSNVINIQNTSANETAPSVALEGNAGAFVVAYDSNIGVNVTEVNSSNGVFSTQSAGQNRFAPAVSINAQNEFLVTYDGNSGNNSFIAGRRALL